LLLHAAREYGVTGLGVTLSRTQFEVASERVREAGLEDSIRIRLRDYRDVDESFDRIVSVGMMEHVPRRQYAEYFEKIARGLRPGGFGLVHTIGCALRRNEHDAFIQKYVFPDSNQPKLSEMARFLERHALPILDVENIGRHYAPTLEGWLSNFLRNRASLSAAYDERFRRMWEYYLSCGIAAARSADATVFQVLFTRDVGAERPMVRV
jgi:cyclopropane-fatty-acyl-phospholipid synthase